MGPRALEVNMETLTKMWSILALRGGLALVLGVALLTWPSMTVGTLLLMFGLFALIDGFATMQAGITGAGDGQSWAALVWEGALAMALGAVTVTLSRMGEHALLHVISAWFLLVGISKLIVAVRLRREVHGELLIVICGLVGVGIGLALYFYPVQEALEGVQVVAAGALVMGVLLSGLALRLHRRLVMKPLMATT
jgi:uncharacterized membrane protein HdeD (DUF308 family)